MTTIARITTALLLATTLSSTACKGEGAGGSEANAEDWSSASLTAQTVTLDGTKLSWTIPEGLTKDDLLSDERKVAMKGGSLSAPSATLKKETIPPTTLANAVEFTSVIFGKESEVLDQREDAGRFVVVIANGNKHRLMVTHFIPAKAGVFSCQISQARSAGVPNFDASLAKFHEICNSVKAE